MDVFAAAASDNNVPARDVVRDIGAPAEPDPVAIFMPAQRTSAAIFASPHSGRVYPPAFLQASRLDSLSLRLSEDAFVDRLFADAPGAGAPLIAATFPRAFLDVNREPWELDPAMFAEPPRRRINARSLRVAGGLGAIARVVADGREIYRGKLPWAEAERRIAELYHPYHQALAGLVTETRTRFGRALLIDCHSMPSEPGPFDRDAGQRRADFVLGDRFGASSAPEIVEAVESAIVSLGYSVKRNAPYAGGFTTERYGRPGDGVHALQIEIRRDLYMDERRVTPHDGFEAFRRDVAFLAPPSPGSDGERRIYLRL